MRPIPIASSILTTPQEHVALCRAYGAVQDRCSRVMAQQQRDIERLEAEVLKLRATVIVRETALALQREQTAERLQTLDAHARNGRPARSWPAHMWIRPWLKACRKGEVERVSLNVTLPGVGLGRARLATADVVARQGVDLASGLGWPG